VITVLMPAPRVSVLSFSFQRRTEDREAEALNRRGDHEFEPESTEGPGELNAAEISGGVRVHDKP